MSTKEQRAEIIRAWETGDWMDLSMAPELAREVEELTARAEAAENDHAQTLDSVAAWKQRAEKAEAELAHARLDIEVFEIEVETLKARAVVLPALDWTHETAQYVAGYEDSREECKKAWEKAGVAVKWAE